MKILKVEYIDERRIFREIKKVCRRDKNFLINFEQFKRSILIQENCYEIIREVRKKFMIINKTKCDKKKFWKHYMKDSNFKNMIRIIFFIQNNKLYVIEIYHHKDKKDCDYSLCKKYCDFI